MKKVNEYIIGQDESVYDIPVTLQNGGAGDLSEYKGKVMLIVNTATGCGFTPQYRFLEETYRKYKEKGFEILDFPCNQFGRQAPGSNSEIQSFCTSQYDTTFKRYSKVDVKGNNAAPLFVFLTKRQGFKGFSLQSKDTGYLVSKLKSEDPDYDKNDDVKWNFTKFLIDRDGNAVARYEATDPVEDIEKDIAGLL
ncbi:MAG: glutathione peroxidase [Lachnospiraceae bacterium]|nr:glutathione peroxidase [Lachnospiraceae bacterium]